MSLKNILGIGILVLFMFSCMGCAGTSPRVRKITKPIDSTAESLVKVRELKGEGGKTRAVVSPADERQLRIPF